MDVEGRLQLLGEGFDAGALPQEVAAQVVHLLLEHFNRRHAVLEQMQLVCRLRFLYPQQPQLCQLLRVRLLPLRPPFVRLRQYLRLYNKLTNHYHV